jgi:hypothetical protein
MGFVRIKGGFNVLTGIARLIVELKQNRISQSGGQLERRVVMKLRVVAIVIFLSGLALFVSSRINAQKTAQANSGEQKPFVIHYLVSRSSGGGSLQPYEYRVKYVNSSGEWKESRYSFDGQVVTWSASKDGLYIVRKDSLQYYGKYDPEMIRHPNASREAITASPQFTRTEKVAGLEAYILKDSGVDAETEMAFALETGKIPLRTVSTLRQGDRRAVNMIEAVGVEFRDIAEDEFRLPTLPLRFDVASQRAQALRQAGQSELAETLEKTMSTLKANH